MIFVGVDRAEAHDDALVMDEAGAVLGRGRCGVGVSALAHLHGLVADPAAEPDEVSVGGGIDRGPVVDSLVGAGCRGARSTRWRPAATATRARARAHRGLVWMRQRQARRLRSALRDDFPAALAAFGTGLARPAALAILQIAPTPERARGRSRARIAAALARAGRTPNLRRRAAVIQAALRADHPEAAAPLAEAVGAAAGARVAVVASLNQQIAEAERRLAGHF